ncbi:hypothetical protein [Neisseria sp.]|uniref:hypothetical protein n=1 Tax=Neisseria sp. TaxID=192066 RepID=UPI0026DCFAE4|nr:hypothetical protein [Neisseria sp.]MDO4907235.1 hypothetical protein [Neisseria sp.]
MVAVVDNYPEFSPFVSVGDFKFDTDIGLYKKLLKDFSYESPDEFGTEYYESPDENLLLGIKNNEIISIFCYKELYFLGLNLIGLTLSEFQQIFQCDYVGEVDEIYLADENYPTYVYEFDGIGAQVWVALEKIVTIIVGGKEAYSTEPYDD